MRSLSIVLMFAFALRGAGDSTTSGRSDFDGEAIRLPIR